MDVENFLPNFFGLQPFGANTRAPRGTFHSICGGIKFTRLFGLSSEARTKQLHGRVMGLGRQQANARARDGHFSELPHSQRQRLKIFGVNCEAMRLRLLFPHRTSNFVLICCCLAKQLNGDDGNVNVGVM